MTGTWRGRRSRLRTRLLVAFVVPLVAVLALVGFVSVAALRSELVHQVDDRLGNAGFRATEAAQGHDGDQGPLPPPGAGGRNGEPDLPNTRGRARAR